MKEFGECVNDKLTNLTQDEVLEVVDKIKKALVERQIPEQYHNQIIQQNLQRIFVQESQIQCVKEMDINPQELQPKVDAIVQKHGPQVFQKAP